MVRCSTECKHIYYDSESDRVYVYVWGGGGGGGRPMNYKAKIHKTQMGQV